VFNNNPVNVVMLGGAAMLVAAAFVSRVKDVGELPTTGVEQDKGAAVPLASH